MERYHILNEIQRTAKANGGKPLGRKRFESDTGIKESDWYGKYWRRWSDAVIEAGYEPNDLNGPLSEEHLLVKLVELTRELGRFPVNADLRMKRRTSPDFPSHNTFRKFGNKAALIDKMIGYCQRREGLDDVLAICQAVVPSPQAPKQNGSPEAIANRQGCVYLLKCGRYFKIGRSNCVGRRAYELAIQLPEEVNTIHTISTDDPAGVEAYWHKRFAPSRKNGEWFSLSQEEIKAFRRRKFM